MKQYIQKIRELLSQAGIAISEEQAEMAARYIGILLEENKKINLFSRKAGEQELFLHFLDSVMPLRLLDFSKGCRVLDIGSGGGFPAIPMQIIRPDILFVLFESIRKKAGVLINFKETCNFKNIEIRNERIESAKPSSPAFDYAISRAAGSLRELAKWSEPHLIAGASLIVFKTNELFEHEARQLTSSSVSRRFHEPISIPYNLPGRENSFCLACLKKRG